MHKRRHTTESKRRQRWKRIVSVLLFLLLVGLVVAVGVYLGLNFHD